MGPAPTVYDWRAAADPDDLREYDAFGPWIDQVRTSLAMPRRFLPWYAELADLGFILKVPRNIDRAQARPGQDLYRSVIAVGRDRLCHLELTPAGVQRHDALLTEVVASNVHTNLLVGVWTLFLADGSTIVVEFNTVGHAMIANAERLVRSGGRTPAPGSDRLPVRADPVPVADHYFSSVLAERRATSDEVLVPLHVELPGRACRDDRNRRRVATGLMAIASASDLVIVNRDEPTRPRFRWGTYATNVLTVAWARITSFRVVPPPPEQPLRFHRLELRCGAQTIVQPCLVEPTGLVAVLRERGIAAAP